MDAIEVFRTILAFLIPASLAMLGSICLGLTLGLIVVDMPGGVNWSGIGGFTAFIGGFGALGAAGGWIGQQIASGQQQAMSWVQQYGHQLIGGGILVAALLIAGVWVYKHLFGSGIDAGGKGKSMKKIRKLLKAGAIALVGATVAIAIPKLYDGIDWAVSHLHSLVA